MKCKKCRKEIPDGSKFCNLCGTPQKNEKMYRRPDGLYEKIVTMDGKRVAFRGKSEKEVTRKIADFQGVKERGKLFGEVVENWKTESLDKLEHNTRVGYKKAIERADDRFGEVPIKDISPKDVQAYAALLESKGFSFKTVKNHLSVLNLIFKYAVINQDSSENPAQYIKAAKNLPRHIRELPSDEQLELVKASFHLKDGLLPFTILYTGCRRGEIIALTHGDIDRKNKTIKITKSSFFEGNKPNEKMPKSLAGVRTIPLLDVLAEKIPKGKADALLFPGKHGMMTSSEFRSAWNSYCKEIGEYTTYSVTDKNNHTHAKIIPNFSPHQLRHGYATILYEAGIDPKDAQELLGHTSLKMTSDIYTHIRKSRRQETANKLNDYTKNTQ